MFVVLAADCREGTKLSGDEQSCIDCVRGEYQDKPWQSSCVECPDDDTTPSTRSTSIDDCKRMCDLPNSNPPFLQLIVKMKS